MGRGRGNSVCHTGSAHSRRGETYNWKILIQFRREERLIYISKRAFNCVECHQTGRKGMGDMQRKASCQDCHMEIEQAHAKSIHKNLTCTACHVNEAGGYQITIWGKGYVGAKETPFKKYSLYYESRSL